VVGEAHFGHHDWEGGTGNNTYTGATTINSGTLKAEAANALANTSQVVLNNGGSFLVTAENAVNDDAAINLNGGRMAMSGNFNETVGALTLSANSTLSSNLANISFYSDSGTTSIGSGFERGFTGAGTEIRAVPETETYFYAVALLAGLVIQFIRRRAKRKPPERQLPAFATRATARQRDRSPG
jgi:hypothetical protein